MRSPPQKEIPFEFRGNLIVLDVFVNGVSLRFCLDTGAHQSFIDSFYVEAIGLDRLEETTVSTIGGLVSATIVKTKVFQIGEYEFPDWNLLACSRIPAGEGLVGGDILKHFRVTIDYKKQVLKLERN